MYLTPNFVKRQTSKLLGIMALLIISVCFANAQSTYKGQWSGEWTAKTVGLCFFEDGESQHKGTWSISITSDGEIIGTEFDKTAGEKATLKGFVDNDSYFKITLKGQDGSSNIIKGKEF